MTCSLDTLVHQIRSCRLCAAHLPDLSYPVVRAHSACRILIVGQAPSRKLYKTGLSFDDVSGDRLRAWLGVTREEFYTPELFSFAPMGFCYPGTGAGGDLPPRPECAATWRAKLLAVLPNICLTLLLGQYAQAWHLRERQKPSLMRTVAAWRDYWEEGLVPLPHPSPRNIRLLQAHPWFEAEMLPVLRSRVQELI